LMNWTWPSAIVTLTPPGWALVEGTVQLESVLQPTLQLWSKNRHPLKIDSLGVWTALNIVAPGMPKIHR
jgi:hypothetical protein